MPVIESGNHHHPLSETQRVQINLRPSTNSEETLNMKFAEADVALDRIGATTLISSLARELKEQDHTVVVEQGLPSEMEPGYSLTVRFDAQQMADVSGKTIANTHAGAVEQPFANWVSRGVRVSVSEDETWRVKGMVNRQYLRDQGIKPEGLNEEQQRKWVGWLQFADSNGTLSMEEALALARSESVPGFDTREGAELVGVSDPTVRSRRKNI